MVDIGGGAGTPVGGVGALTGQAVIDVARRFLNDEVVAAQRYADAVLLTFLNEAQNALWSIRPDLLLNDDDTYGSVVDLATVASNISFPDKWQYALAYYMVHLALSRDSADTLNAQRSEWFRQRFLASALNQGMGAMRQ